MLPHLVATLGRRGGVIPRSSQEKSGAREVKCTHESREWEATDLGLPQRYSDEQHVPGSKHAGLLLLNEEHGGRSGASEKIGNYFSDLMSLPDARMMFFRMCF